MVGNLPIAESERQPPLSAALGVLAGLVPVLDALHRPRGMRISWAEYDARGKKETAFHELDEVDVPSWDAMRMHVEGLAAAGAGTVAVNSIFVELDTRIADEEGESWSESSAELQLSFDPELAPDGVAVGYVTGIDVWLSTTYGEGYAPRSNHAAAARNRPRIEAFLRELRRHLGASFSAGLSKLYYFALTDEGFRDVDELPPRGPRSTT